MRSIITLISIVSIFVGLSKNDNFSGVFNWLENNIFYNEITILEGKFSREEIKQKICKDKMFLSNIVSLELHPYLLMDIKFTTDDEKTKEGLLIWGLHHGEMVLSTDNWQLSRGIGDCITKNTSSEEMELLGKIHKNNGKINFNELTESKDTKKYLHALNGCKRKKLIIQSNDNIRLHVQDPVWIDRKETKIKNALRNKSQKTEKTVSQRFGHKQIIKFAENLFGETFVVRSYKTIYIPVYLVTYKDQNKNLKSIRINTISGDLYCAKIFN